MDSIQPGTGFHTSLFNVRSYDRYKATARELWDYCSGNQVGISFLKKNGLYKFSTFKSLGHDCELTADRSQLKKKKTCADPTHRGRSAEKEGFRSRITVGLTIMIHKLNESGLFYLSVLT